MKYRKLGSTGVDISEISLGAEHLENKDPAAVDAVVKRAIDRGINYVDIVAYTSSANRDAMGAAIYGKRDDILISVHFGAVEQDGKYLRTRDPALCEASFEDLLRRLQTDHADVLMLHCIDDDEDFERAFDRNGYLGSAMNLKSQGKARMIAISTHIVSIAEKAIQSGGIDALMFPVNPAHDLFPGDYGLEEMWDESTMLRLMSREVDSVTTRGNLYHRWEAGVGLIAMKTYAGGLLLSSGLTSEFPEEMQGLKHPAGMVLSPVQCISYVLERPGVSTALVGCQTPEQIDDALAYYDASEAERDFSSIEKHRLWRLAGRCTYCNHCLPCPEDIPIGDLIRLLDTAESFRNRQTEIEYRELAKHGEDCTGCEVCMNRCPFSVRVTDRMKAAATLFGY